MGKRYQRIVFFVLSVFMVSVKTADVGAIEVGPTTDFTYGLRVKHVEKKKKDNAEKLAKKKSRKAKKRAASKAKKEEKKLKKNATKKAEKAHIEKKKKDKPKKLAKKKSRKVKKEAVKQKKSSQPSIVKDNSQNQKVKRGPKGRIRTTDSTPVVKNKMIDPRKEERKQLAKQRVLKRSWKRRLRIPTSKTSSKTKLYNMSPEERKAKKVAEQEIVVKVRKPSGKIVTDKVEERRAYRRQKTNADLRKWEKDLVKNDFASIDKKSEQDNVAAEKQVKKQKPKENRVIRKSFQKKKKTKDKIK